MSQLFTPVSNTLLRTTLAGGVAVVSLLVFVMLAIARSPYMTNQNITVEQPVPFSHQHHVGDIGIDCRYCHQGVENSARAGVPSTQVCMNCHSNLWNQAPLLAPIRDSYRLDQPIAWNRVHDLPDYVYFNHSIHIHKGIGCYSCHGDVSEMPLMRRDQPLTMQWCLECHRAPEQHVRPEELIYVTKPLGALVAADQSISELRTQLAQSNALHGRVDCYTCHR